MVLLSDGGQARENVSPTNRKLLIQKGAESTTAAKHTKMLSYFKSPAVWFIGISFIFVSIGSSAVITHEVLFITDMKESLNIAVWTCGITLGVGAISALASDRLADRLISRYVAILYTGKIELNLF
jgi:predicted MFS family arabinose efflux permease